ncbi:MAG: hypothetical protein OEW99_00215 [Gammaproteobacteria bacterium]|nr:hypothetical protein [Gammaproteobacteria bacterium]
MHDNFTVKETKQITSQSYPNQDNDEYQRFFTERVNELYNHPLHFMLFTQFAMVLLTIWYLWESIPKHFLLTWLFFGLISSLGMAYNISAFRKEKLTYKKSKYWLNLFIISMCVLGMLWGTPAIFPNLFNSPNTVMFVSILLLGLVAGAVTVISSFISLFYIFSILALLPMTIMFFYTNDSLYNTFGSMYLVYFAVQVVSAKNMNRELLNSLSLRFKNIELVNNLQVKNHQAEEARIEAEQANISKSKFLAAASHDLRQPLHALGLFVSKIHNNQRYPEIKNDIENIKQSSDALEDLLNALLDISKLDAGVLQPNLSPVSLRVY